MAALTPQAFCSMSYDYLIAGGGTAGLAVAARLTEDSSVTVGVLEAGHDLIDDPMVYTPAFAWQLQNDPKYDWSYKSIPQINASNQMLAQNRGRMLGGSSGINLLQYTHAAQDDLDAWEELGNPGWDWNSIFQYYKAAENYQEPTVAEFNGLQAGYIDPKLHGVGGGINASFPSYFTSTESAWGPTFSNLGLGIHGDPRDGIQLGGYANLLTVDKFNGTRSFSGNSYYKPVRNRTNLKVLTSALITKINFDSDRKDGLVVKGLTFIVNNQTYTVNATKEVVLSAGVFGSPKLLELSGIGNAKLLNSLGIPVLMNQTRVGENLQDHQQFGMSYQVVPGQDTLDARYNNQTLEDLVQQEFNSNHSGPLSTTGIASIAFLSYTQVLDHLGLGNASKPASLIQQHIPGPYEAGVPGLTEQYDILKRKLSLANTTFVSHSAGPGSTSAIPANITARYFSHGCILVHPFARGSSHINTTDPTGDPEIDPRYLSHPIDVEILIDTIQQLIQVGQTPPMSSLLLNNGTVYAPGDPDFKNRTDIEAKLRVGVFTGWHPVGTLGMMPYDKGGVVSERLRVFGTRNLRVIDSSIAPMIPRGNTVSMTYMIAEKGAAMLKEDRDKSLPVVDSTHY